MFIISVLAQGKTREVILLQAGQPVVNTEKYVLMTCLGVGGLAP
jgi:hypothetical protein